MQHDPDTNRNEWLKRVEAALKGAAFNADSALQPRKAGPRALKPTHAPWRILMRLDHQTVSAAQTQARTDIENGADGLVLAATSLTPALDGLPLHKLLLRNEAGDEGAEALRMLITRQPVDPSRMAVDFSVSGASLAKVIHSNGFTSPLMKADGRNWHVQGCSDAAELGAALAEALAKMRKLDFLGNDELASAVSMTLAASQDMFRTIAKFRAARILWKDVLQGSGLPVKPLALHAETSRVMMAALDAHSNILRGVAACFAAGIGGADSMVVLPFSAAQGIPNSFARRVARNLQYMLAHESALWRAEDAAAGAGYIEKLTHDLAAEAWNVMQAAEKGNWPKGNPEESAAKPVIGVTKYQPPKDFPPEIEA